MKKKWVVLYIYQADGRSREVSRREVTGWSEEEVKRYMRSIASPSFWCSTQKEK